MKLLLLSIALLILGACSNNITSVAVQTLVATGHSWNGKQLPPQNLQTPKVTILKVSIPPHSKLGWHSHPVINAGVLLTGQLTVVTDRGKTVHLVAGDGVVETVDTWHYGENTSDEVAEIIVFYVGNYGDTLTIKKPLP